MNKDIRLSTNYFDHPKYRKLRKRLGAADLCGLDCHMKILVTGANGQVGWELARRGLQQGFDIWALDRNVLDITDPAAVDGKIRQPGLALAVNAAAYTAVDRAESEVDLAFAVNRDGPGHLAMACAEAGVPLVHISSDYVFDGRKEGPYLETDPVSPLGVYGESKLAGEVEVRSRHKRHLILRSAWVYGLHGHNFVKTMIRLGREREVLRVVADQHGCPTYAADIADTILAIARCLFQRQQIPWGTYHYCGKGTTSWYGFAQQIFSLVRQHTSLKVMRIEPLTTAQYPTPAERPANSALDCSLIEKEFGLSPPPWPTSLARMIDQLFK